MKANIENFKHLKLILYVIIILSLIINNISKAQMFKLPSDKSGMDNIKLKTESPAALKKDKSNLSQTPSYIFSDKEKQLQSEIEKLKQPGISKPEGEKFIQLQREIEKINGSTITKQEANDLGTIIPANRYNTEQTDNLSSSYILFGGGGLVAGLAAQVEQIGATAGKIWVAVGLANGDTGVFALPDTIAIYYSNDNGSSYNLYARIGFSSHNKIEFDNMDMELIENFTGQKYLHLVFGYTTNGGYGQNLIGYTIISAPVLGYSGTTLFPPGYNSNSKYTKARITSDNVRFPANSWVTIAVTQDSIAGQNHYFMTKMCRVLNPFNVSPTVTYLSQCIYGIAPGHNYEVFTDVANYHNGGDSLIFVLSSYPGYESGIYFYKAFNNSVVYPVASGNVIPSGDNIEFARIAATGGTDQNDLMITYSDNYLNSGDFDQFILYTFNANDWLGFSLDFTTYNYSRYGDIIGRRNTTGSFSITFKNIYGNMENVSSYSFSDLISTGQMHASNTDYANSYASPKPLFRYLNNDSCLNIWSYYYSVTSTGGCSASNLYITTALEGFYDEVTDQHSVETYEYVRLAETSPPYNIVDSALAYLDYDGMSNVFTFPKGLTGNYFLVVKHYNSLETWSAAPVYITQNTHLFYDFTSSDAQAFGNNMVFKGNRWCLFSGDVNQDGTIDLTDVVSIYNDASEFIAIKYAVTDLNGDSFTDLTDVVLASNNASAFVSLKKP